MNNLSIILLLVLVGAFIYIYLQNREIQLHKLQQEDLDQYVLDVEAIYRLMRGVRHDYRNHLQVMAAYLNTEQYDKIKNYVKQLSHEMNQVDTIIRSGDTMIDALVNTKLSLAKEAGVQIEATAIAPSELSISDMELAIILGNLLSNAVEAVMRSAPQEQFIRVYIAPMKGNLYINVTNSMQDNPRQHFFSLKRLNREGYGIRRIDQATHDLEGVVNRQWEDGIFSTEITLPIQIMEA